MPHQAPYDSYDYPSFWIGREYEHRADEAALKKLLAKTTKAKTLIDLGAGFGRMALVYLPHVEQAVLLDPSGKLLQVATGMLSPRFNNFSTVKGTAQSLPERLKNKKFDLVLVLRVMHHIKNPEKVFEQVANLLPSGGFFILEFANKINFKARLRALRKRNFAFLKDETPLDMHTKLERGGEYIFFSNHHPKKIISLLEESGFEVIDKLSVSNFRNSLLKKILPLPALLFLERIAQKVFAFYFFGPSIFLLAKKT